MSPASTDSSTYRFKKEIENEFYRWGKYKYFLPIAEQTKLLSVTNSLAKSAFNALYRGPNDAEREKHFRQTMKSAPKLFALLVETGKGKYIKEFLQEGIQDSDLPFVEVQDTPTRRQGYHVCLGTRTKIPIRATSAWEFDDKNRLLSMQWWFLATVFDTQGKHYDLDEGSVLPFVEDGENSEDSSKAPTGGGFSDVWSVKIHAAHQTFYKPNGMEEPEIAVKRCHSAEREDFEREVQMLKEVAKREHSHIIMLLATYKYRGKYHMLFPHAAMNLKEYVETKDSPSWEKESALWVLEQMTGLASAIHMVHNFAIVDSQPSKSHNLTVEVEPTETRYGRHGDVKPENILYFDDGRGIGGEGTLQIADFGLSKFHGRLSRSAIRPEVAIASMMYEPPEIPLKRKVSRAYDIWSLGCVFLILITWRLGGSEKVLYFEDRRSAQGGDGIENDKFFTIINYYDKGYEDAEVRAEVVQWFEFLQRHPRCCENSSMRDLLLLIKDKMLVIDKQGRISSGNLEAQLKEISLKAASDATYLFGKSPSPDIEAWISEDPLQKRSLPNGDQTWGALLRPSSRPSHGSHFETSPYRTSDNADMGTTLDMTDITIPRISVSRAPPDDRHHAA